MTELPLQQYCDSCGGPLMHEGDGWFVSHALRDCIDWMARKDRFSRPVVFSGCRGPMEPVCPECGAEKGNHVIAPAMCSRARGEDATV